MGTHSYLLSPPPAEAPPPPEEGGPQAQRVLIHVVLQGGALQDQGGQPRGVHDPDLLASGQAVELDGHCRASGTQLQP